MRRRPPRGLSREDRAVWDQVRATTKPLWPGRERDAPSPVAFSPVAPAGPAKPSVKPAARSPSVQEHPAGTVPRAGTSLSGSPALSMDWRAFEKLRRGRLVPEARLDLHGMSAEHAHSALIGFISRAHADGLRLVLVITGKGRPPDMTGPLPQRHGILRHNVPHWLSAPPLIRKVLQVVEAHQKHGGAGALYVYLRRQR